MYVLPECENVKPSDVTFVMLELEYRVIFRLLSDADRLASVLVLLVKITSNLNPPSSLLK